MNFCLRSSSPKSLSGRSKASARRYQGNASTATVEPIHFRELGTVTAPRQQGSPEDFAERFFATLQDSEEQGILRAVECRCVQRTGLSDNVKNAPKARQIFLPRLASRLA
jgi:hypothetical protein